MMSYNSQLYMQYFCTYLWMEVQYLLHDKNKSVYDMHWTHRTNISKFLYR